MRYRTKNIVGQEVFYREAGPEDAPTLVLLHGFPASSHMFRDLIPLLADRFHVIAPDHIGFGYSAMPSVDDFEYTFARLAEVTEALLDDLGINRYAIYVQDYGAPIGWRLALGHPESVTAIVSQNGNAYREGLVPAFWDGLLAYGANPTPETEAGPRAALGLESTRWQYLNGEPDGTLISPDAWALDQALLDRVGNADIQLALFRDYPRNVELYPRVHEYFRDSQVPLLAIWGKGDEIFGPEGARAFQQDLPRAEVHLIDGGHFALEAHHHEIADRMTRFLASSLFVPS